MVNLDHFINCELLKIFLAPPFSPNLIQLSSTSTLQPRPAPLRTPDWAYSGMLSD